MIKPGGGNQKISLNYLRSSVNVTRTIKTFCNVSSHKPPIPAINQPSRGRPVLGNVPADVMANAMAEVSLHSADRVVFTVFCLPKDSSFFCAWPILLPLKRIGGARHRERECPQRLPDLRATTRDLFLPGYEVWIRFSYKSYQFVRTYPEHYTIRRKSEWFSPCPTIEVIRTQYAPEELKCYRIFARTN